MVGERRFDGKSMWRHVEVLAADDMEGRETGTPGLERAEAYVVDQLKKIGLSPAGTDGYYQPVPILRREIVDNACSAALVREGQSQPLMIGEDAVCTTDIDIAPTVDAPLAFVGYGLKIPEAGFDDFAGLDLKGKIAVTIPSVPSVGDPRLAADAVVRRFDDFRAAGLVGWIFMPGPSAQWTTVARRAVKPKLHPVGELDETHGEQILMEFNPARAEKLLAGTGHTAAELFALAKDGKPLPRFAIPASLRATARVRNTPVASSNVIAKLEGSDPQLRKEYVVLSAHVDHVGIGEPVNGDRIYNGAIDNASGVAALLDVMAELHRERVRPKRSVLLAFFTEKNTRKGSKYFVAHPTVDRKSIVANINIDMVQPMVLCGRCPSFFSTSRISAMPGVAPLRHRTWWRRPEKSSSPTRFPPARTRRAFSSPAFPPSN
jgi:hypothetical protein